MDKEETWVNRVAAGHIRVNAWLSAGSCVSVRGHTRVYAHAPSPSLCPLRGPGPATGPQQWARSAPRFPPQRSPAPQRSRGSTGKGLVPGLGRDEGPDEPETSHCAPENGNAQGNVASQDTDVSLGRLLPAKSGTI